MPFSAKLHRLVLTSALGLAMTMPAVAADFNAKQREEIGTIVHDYLMKNPEVLRDAFQELENRTAAKQLDDARSAIADNKKEIFHSGGDLVMGNPDGDVTLVEFFDYNCGYCKRAVKDIDALIDEDKKLRVVLKEFPILGAGSTYAAQAALASKKQGKYLEFHMALIKHRGSVDKNKVLAVAKSAGLDMAQLETDMKAQEINTIIEHNHKIASKLGIQGTPAFIIDDILVPGAVGKSTLATAVKNVRKNGCKMC